MDPKRDRTRVAGWLPFRKDWPTLQEKRTYSFLKKMSDLMFCLKAFFESCPAFLSPGRGFALYQGKAILGIWGGMASTMVKRGECYWVWWWCTPVIPATQKAEAGGSKCEASLYKLCVCWGLNLGPCACEADSRTIDLNPHPLGRLFLNLKHHFFSNKYWQFRKVGKGIRYKTFSF